MSETLPPAPVAAPRRHLVLAALALILVLVADQAFKAYMLFERDFLANPPEALPLLPVFNLVMVWNRGALFGMGNDQSRWLLVGVAALMVTVLLVWAWRTRDKGSALALGSVMGGAIGNMIDRIRFGAVADFFDAYIGTYHWPAFNVADIGIVLGVALLLVRSWLAPASKGTVEPDRVPAAPPAPAMPEASGGTPGASPG